MQTLSNAIGAVKASEIIAKAKQEPNKPEEKSFHQKERERMSADPENMAYQMAIANGGIEAGIFMSSVKDSKHPKHEANFIKFKYDYDMDSAKAEADIIEKYCKAKNAAPYEMADGNYESGVFNKYRPTGNITLEKHAFFENFQQAMKEKWMKSGYQGDKEFAQAYAAKYGLTPNENTIQTRIFALK